MCACTDACRYACAHAHAHTCIHEKELAWIPPTLGQEKERPHQDVWTTVWRVAMLSHAWGLKDWVSQLSSDILHLEHSISTLLFSEWSPHRTGVRREQQKSRESVSDTRATQRGVTTPLFQCQRQWLFEPMSLTSGVYSITGRFQQRKEGCGQCSKEAMLFNSVLFPKQKSKIFPPPFCFSK